MKPTKKSNDVSCSRPNKIMKSPALRKSEYYINTGVSNITTTVALVTHRWQRRKKTNSLLHFWVLNLKNFSLNPAMMGSQEQTTMNSRLTSQQVSFLFGCPKRSPEFQNGSILLVNASCKRLALILEDEFKNTYFC